MKQISNKISVILICISCISAYAQGTLGEYKKAIIVDSLFKDKVYNTPATFNWMPNNIMWYANNSKDSKQYYIVNPSTKTQKLIFDSEKLAEKINALTKEKISANDLDLKDLEYADGENRFKFQFKNLKLDC